MNKNITGLILLLTIFITALFAQTSKIAYSYDDTSNRIKREFIVSRMAKDTTGKGESEAIKNKHSFLLPKGLSKVLPYQGASINCVNMASLSLWLNGIFIALFYRCL